MGLWHSELQVSARARWCSLLLHGAVMLALLWVPWPAGLTPACLLLLASIALEAVRSQRRVLRRTGLIALPETRQIAWRQRRWQISRRPLITRQAILLALRSATGRKERLWLWRDSMTEEEWRQLRRFLLRIS